MGFCSIGVPSPDDTWYQFRRLLILAPRGVLSRMWARIRVTFSEPCVDSRDGRERPIMCVGAKSIALGNVCGRDICWSRDFTAGDSMEEHALEESDRQGDGYAILGKKTVVYRSRAPLLSVDTERRELEKDADFSVRIAS